MKKFTRKSHNRKVIVFAVSLFMAVSLISVGMAAWVMSAVSNVEATSPVKVAIVSDASLVVTVDQWTKLEGSANYTWDAEEVLSFDAPAGDTGRVRANADSKEKLTMTISGKVTNANTLKGLKITITLPNEIVKAIQEGYIQIVDPATAASSNPTVLSLTGNQLIVGSDEGANIDTVLAWDADADEDYGTFSYTLTFAWGEYFAGMNPALFYDNTDPTKTVNRGNEGAAITGAAIPNDQMKTEMNTFRDTLAGGYGSGTTLLPEYNAGVTYTGQIEILVEATVN